MGRTKKAPEGAPGRATPGSTVALAGAVFFSLVFLFTATVGFFVLLGRDGGWRVIIDAPARNRAGLEFPVGVDPKRELIVENPAVETYFEEHVLANGNVGRHVSWVERAVGKLALMDWYQNLAGVSSNRLLVVLAGERKEEVGAHFGKILGWSADERQAFLDSVTVASPSLPEGKFFPGRYTAEKGASPEEIATLVTERFDGEVLERYGTTTAERVPLKDALVIASLLEREAYDFTDMRQIAGVIWNRLFIDMNLQIDATLQYAKGERKDQPWWPKVLPRDKYIESPYNTYENPGLPPAPIANPSLEALLAALNPKETDCLYYFHDRDAGFHCAPTYEEHVRLLKQYYGRGK